MNILFLTSTFPRTAGDQQAPFVLEQAQAWKSKRPEDALFILAPHDAGAARRELVDGIDVRRFRYMPWERSQTLAYPAILPNIRKRPLRALQVAPFMTSAYFAARSLVKKEKIDLVYAHWVMPQGLVALALKKRLGVPYMLQNHSSDLAVFDKFGSIGRRLARTVLEEAKAFFCVNSNQLAFARSIVPDLKGHVFPMGVSLDRTTAASPPSLAEARYALGTISRLSRKKGIDHLIAAAEVLASRGRLFSLGIAGDGEDAPRLSACPDKADVRFTGFLSGSEKAAFFSDCFAMAFPSVDDAGDVEGMPVALLEALASGKPTIASAATNIRLLPEWSEIENDVELLEAPSDTAAFASAIERVLDLSGPALEQRSKRLSGVMQRYSWERLIDEYLAVVDETMMRK